jgi:hypothetical protein
MTVIDQPINLPETTQSTEHRREKDAARCAPPREKGPGGRNLPFAPNLARPRQQQESGLRARRRPGGSTAHRASRPPGGGPFDGALPHTRAGETVEGEQVARRRGEETSDDPPLPGPSTSPPDLAWRVAHRVEPLTMFTPNVLHLVCACPCAQDEGHNTPVHRGRSRLARRSHGQGGTAARALSCALLCACPGVTAKPALTRGLDPKGERPGSSRAGPSPNRSEPEQRGT